MDYGKPLLNIRYTGFISLTVRASANTFFFINDQSDRQIWDKLRHGHKYALNYIYNQYVEMLYQYGFKFTNDDKQIEDCIQDLFLDLWEKRTGLGETDNIKPYLLTSFRRKLIRALSKNNIIIDRNFAIDSYNFVITASAEVHLTKKEAEAALISTMANHLSKLPKKQREVLYLRYYCELQYDEIASVMNISYQSARNLMYKAIKTMKRNFKSTVFPILTLFLAFF